MRRLDVCALDSALRRRKRIVIFIVEMQKVLLSASVEGLRLFSDSRTNYIFDIHVFL